MEVKASNQITLMNTDLVDAAKTATNYLGFSSDGLVVGDLTGSTLGKNVLIDSDGVDIRSGNTVLASFEANDISLGVNNTASSISLCGNKGKIYVNNFTNSITSKETTSLFMESDDVVIVGVDPNNSSNAARLMCGSSDGALCSIFANNGAQYGFIYVGVDNDNPRAGLTAADDPNTQSSILVTPSSVSLTRGALCSVELHNGMVYIEANDRLSVHSQAWFYSPIYANSSAYMYDLLKVSGNIYADSNLDVSGDIYVGSNNIQITGSNKVLWTGKWAMYDTQTATLSEAISAQVNGIVLVFCAWDANTQTLQEWNWNHVYIPKQDVVYNGTTGHTMALFANGFESIAYKYLYISDTTIKGYANNASTGTANGITYNNAKFVLRYVIGV